MRSTEIPQKLCGKVGLSYGRSPGERDGCGAKAVRVAWSGRHFAEYEADTEIRDLLENGYRYRLNDGVLRRPGKSKPASGIAIVRDFRQDFKTVNIKLANDAMRAGNTISGTGIRDDLCRGAERYHERQAADQEREIEPRTTEHQKLSQLILTG